MIPIKQTKVAIKNSRGETVQSGNCYAAVIASMLEIPITEVPNVEVFFPISKTYWIEVMDEYLRLRGCELVTDTRFKVFHIENFPTPEWAGWFMELQDKYYFVSGDSLRGVKHICIFKNGVLVHDPHPSNDGLLTYDIFQTLDKI